MGQQPETRFKKKFRGAFDTHFPKGTMDAFRTPIAGGLLQRPGIPDDFFAARHCFAWMEFKVGKNKLSGSQRHTCAQLTGAGQAVLIVRDENQQVFSVERFSAPGLITIYSLEHLNDINFWLDVLLVGRTTK